MQLATALQIVNATSSLLLGVAGIVIGYTQFRLAQAKAHYELYDRRIKIYDSFAKLLAYANVGSPPDDSATRLLYEVVNGADFLFPKGIGEGLRRLCIEGDEWRRLHCRAFEQKNEEARERDWNSEDRHRECFERLARELENKFVRYMTVRL